MYKIPALTNWAMWVYWGVRWDLNPCHKEPQSSALPDWATNTVLMERLELSTTALWEQLSTIEVHQLLLFLTNVGMVRIELTCNQLLFQLFIRQRRYIPICWEGRNWTHNCWFWRPVFYHWTTSQFIVAGSGFAPLVSSLWVGQDYYFSNLLKHQIIDYFSLLHSENFQKWWHQVLQATWLNSLQKFLRDL